MASRLAAAALLALSLTRAILVARAQDHVHTPVSKSPTSAWYHADDHPIYSLFKRQPVTDGASYATVGTEEWSSGYPPGLPDTSELPQEWVNALNAAVSAGKIPDIPQSHNSPDQDPTYPDGI